MAEIIFSSVEQLLELLHLETPNAFKKQGKNVLSLHPITLVTAFPLSTLVGLVVWGLVRENQTACLYSRMRSFPSMSSSSSSILKHVGNFLSVKG